jgi:hypothetical protein
LLSVAKVATQAVRTFNAICAQSEFDGALPVYFI